MKDLLSESLESQYLNILQSSPMGMVAYSGPELRIVFINAAGETLWGPAAINDKTFDDAFPDQKNSAIRDELLKVYYGGEDYFARAQRVERDFGSGTTELRYYNVTVKPRRNVEGKIIGLLSYGFDVTSEVLARIENEATAKEFLKRSKDEHDFFLTEATSLLGSSLDYTHTLKALAKLSVPKISDWCSVTVMENGVPDNIAVAHWDPLKKDSIADYQKRFPTNWKANIGPAEVVRSGKSELHTRVYDEQLQFAAVGDEHLEVLRSMELKSVMIVPLTVRNRTIGTISFISTSDSRLYTQSDLKFAEELGRRAAIAIDNARLYKKSQDAIRARDEFLSIASHELKTPLTPLKMQIQFLKHQLESGELAQISPERLQQIATTSDRQITRLVNLIEELLDVARISSDNYALNPENCNLGDMIQEVIERYGPQLVAAGCWVEISQVDSIQGQWNRTGIEQVFVNLITNAIKYAPKKPISVRTCLEKGQAIVSVSDQGIGIPEDDQEKIFNRFERAGASKSVKGLGLGLFICRKIVEAHGGRIRVESKLGEGSTFIVNLPLKIDSRL